VDYLQVIILAIVQGLTEFLPVSSSGHLVVGSAVMESLGFPHPPDLLEVNIVLHVGTLGSILLFYSHKVWRLFKEDRQLIPRLIVGTIPAAVIGIPLKELAENLLESPLLAGLMFPVTALILLWATRQPVGDASYRNLSYARTVRIGFMQALAVLPGISRSGATIAAGLREGLDRQSAVTFAFLLAIPVIGGAGLIEVTKLARQTQHPDVTDSTSPQTAIPTADRLPTAAAPPAVNPPPATQPTAPLTLVVGGLIAMLVGWLALWWLVRWIQAGRLGLFAWYLIPLGVTVVAWQLWN